MMTVYSAFRNPPYHIVDYSQFGSPKNNHLPKNVGSYISLIIRCSLISLKNMIVKFGNLPQGSGWKLKIFVFHPPSFHWISDCLILIWWLHDMSSPYNWNDLWKCMSFYKWGPTHQLIIENIQLQKKSRLKYRTFLVINVFLVGGFNPFEKY